MPEAFRAVWCRPYGMPKTVFMDPDHRNISVDFQRYLVRHDIQLLHAAAESHWQLGKVEVCNRILRGMAQRAWAAGSTASPEETIRGRGLLSTRHGVWLGPGRIIGTESLTNSPIPRLIWVSFSGILYRCSPETLRPLPEDEALFSSESYPKTLQPVVWMMKLKGLN